MKDRRKGERRSYDGKVTQYHPYVERRKTIIKAGRRTGVVGEYYGVEKIGNEFGSPANLIWEVKNLREKEK